jgi:hypothetical protein
MISSLLQIELYFIYHEHCEDHCTIMIYGKRQLVFMFMFIHSSSSVLRYIQVRETKSENKDHGVQA